MRSRDADILTVGRYAFTSDDRFSVAFSPPDQWTLLVKDVQEADQGAYECQISTEAKMARRAYLNVIGK